MLIDLNSHMIKEILEFYSTKISKLENINSNNNKIIAENIKRIQELEKSLEDLNGKYSLTGEGSQYWMDRYDKFYELYCESEAAIIKLNEKLKAYEEKYHIS